MKNKETISNMHPMHLFEETRAIETHYVEKIETYIVNTRFITTDEEKQLISDDIDRILYLTDEIKNSLENIQKKCCPTIERDYVRWDIDKNTGERHSKR